MHKTLRKYGKKIEPRAAELFFERVGFHPVAVAVEAEKLVHFIGDKPTIPVEAVEEIAARPKPTTRDEIADELNRRLEARRGR
jgi:DNA polymerase-3 subunit delta